jgi:hypothetical protein
VQNYSGKQHQFRNKVEVVNLCLFMSVLRKNNARGCGLAFVQDRKKISARGKVAPVPINIMWTWCIPSQILLTHQTPQTIA